MFCQWLTVVDWSFVIDITYLRAPIFKILYRNVVKDIIKWKQMKLLLTDIMLIDFLKQIYWFNGYQFWLKNYSIEEIQQKKSIQCLLETVEIFLKKYVC